MKIPFNKDQINLMKIIGVEFDVSAELSDDHIFEIERKAVDYLQSHGINKGNLNAAGKDCRNLLDMLADY